MFLQTRAIRLLVVIASLALASRAAAVDRHIFTEIVDGSQVMLPTTAEGQALITLIFHDDGTFDVKGTISKFSPEITAVNIHLGAFDVQGEVIVELGIRG